MPIATRFSKTFYDKFGEELAQEMVDWFNQMDQTYRDDLKTLNELNFARFDAKLEQRVAELRIEIAALRAELVKWMFIFWLGTVGTFIAVARLLLT
jgi:hypothetical protein